MSGWVLDTNVISELSRARPEKLVVTFLEESRDLTLSVMTLHELEYGVAMAPPQGQKKLRRWLEDLEGAFEGRIISVDARISRSAAKFRAVEARRGRVLSPLDSLIAATALSSGAGLATRNTADFEQLGVTLINPWLR